MIRNSVVSKLWLTFIGVVVVVLSLLSVFLEQLFGVYFYNEQTTNLLKKAEMVNQVLHEYGDDQQLAFQMVKVIAEEEGTLITSLPANNPQVNAILSKISETDRTTLLAGTPVLTKQNLQVGGVQPGVDNVWAISALSTKGVFQGLLILNQPIVTTQSATDKIRSLIFFAAGFGILLTTGLAFVVSKNLSRPLIQMNQVAERIAEGDFEGEIDIVTGDEVGQLGKTLNKMARTIRANLEELLKESELSSGILASMADGVISTDLDGNILLVNPQAKALLHYTASEVENRDRIPKDLLDVKEEVVAIGDRVEREFTWKGHFIYVSMTPLFEPGKRDIRGIVAVLRDITQEKTLEEMRKDFVANVSHELRTPLALMQGYSEALLDEFGDDPVQRKELTTIILDETHRMRRLVGDLLDLAQLQSGHFLLQEEEVSIDSLCKRVTRKFTTLVTEKQIVFQYVPAVRQVFVKGDADRLEQVLTNLLDNAIRHTSENGTVTLSAEETEECVRLKVSDTGHGIPEDALPFIFERFYKVDKARTRSKSGTGLGLAIAYNIVQQHKGRIEVKSVVDLGTTFEIQIPKLKTL